MSIGVVLIEAYIMIVLIIVYNPSLKLFEYNVRVIIKISKTINVAFGQYHNLNAFIEFRKLVVTAYKKSRRNHRYCYHCFPSSTSPTVPTEGERDGSAEYDDIDVH